MRSLVPIMRRCIGAAEYDVGFEVDDEASARLVRDAQRFIDRNDGLLTY